MTGATASVRGSARFATFAAGKFAVRGLTQSLAREFGPRGVHVAHAIIDGVIDIPRTKDYTVNDGKEDGKISTDAVSLTGALLSRDPRPNRRVADRVVVDCRELLALAYAAQVQLHTGARSEAVCREVLTGAEREVHGLRSVRLRRLLRLLV